ncbi:MAG: hypothetical protein AAFX50_08485, partial [Acidobacteriota bacterium]
MQPADAPAALWVDGHGEPRLSWPELHDGAWSLEGVRLSPTESVVTEPPRSLPVPGDTAPDAIAVAALDVDRLLVAWREGAHLWAGVASTAGAGPPVLISESASGALELLVAGADSAQLFWTERSRTFRVSIAVVGASTDIGAKQQAIASELRAAALTDGGTLVFGLDRVALVNTSSALDVLELGALAEGVPASSSFAAAARGKSRLAVAWADADGGVHAQWLGTGRPHGVRPADGASIDDVQLAIGASGAWISWLESRDGEGVRIVKRLPEIFADGFEAG